jgi:hypothetical protein
VTSPSVMSVTTRKSSSGTVNFNNNFKDGRPPLSLWSPPLFSYTHRVTSVMFTIPMRGYVPSASGGLGSTSSASRTVMSPNNNDVPSMPRWLTKGNSPFRTTTITVIPRSIADTTGRDQADRTVISTVSISSDGGSIERGDDSGDGRGSGSASSSTAGGGVEGGTAQPSSPPWIAIHPIVDHRGGDGPAPPPPPLADDERTCTPLTRTSVL